MLFNYLCAQVEGETLSAFYKAFHIFFSLSKLFKISFFRAAGKRMYLFLCICVMCRHSAHIFLENNTRLFSFFSCSLFFLLLLQKFNRLKAQHFFPVVVQEQKKELKMKKIVF